MRIEVVKGDCEEGVSYMEGERSQSHTSQKPAVGFVTLRDDGLVMPALLAAALIASGLPSMTYSPSRSAVTPQSL